MNLGLSIALPKSAEEVSLLRVFQEWTSHAFMSEQTYGKMQYGLSCWVFFERNNLLQSEDGLSVFFCRALTKNWKTWLSAQCSWGFSASDEFLTCLAKFWECACVVTPSLKTCYCVKSSPFKRICKVLLRLLKWWVYAFLVWEYAVLQLGSISKFPFSHVELSKCPLDSKAIAFASPLLTSAS